MYKRGSHDMRSTNKISSVSMINEIINKKILALKTAQNIEFLWDSVITDFITDQKVTGAKIQNLKTSRHDLTL